MTLTIAPAAKPRYYREESYYSDGALRSEWFGRGTEPWGLSGPVGQREELWLAKGYSPDGKRVPLVQNAGREDRFGGQDQTFSPPGDVKVLWGLERDPMVRRAIERALFEAAKDTLRFEEETMLYARRGHGGRVIEKATGGLWSLYFHASNRSQSPEPSPHLHALDHNLQWRRDGTWGAMNNIAAKRGEERVLSRSTIYACKLELGQIHAESLRLQLEALGYRTADASPRMGHFTIPGVPRELVMKFSSRTKEIEADMKARGVKGAKEARVSAKRTRRPKRHVPLAQLRERWIREADGWNPASIRERVEEKAVTYRVPDELRACVEAKVQAQLHRKAKKSQSTDADQRPRRIESEQQVQRSVPIVRTESLPPAREMDERLRRLLHQGSRARAGITSLNLYLSRRLAEHSSKATFSEAEKSSLNAVTRGRGRVQFLGSKTDGVRVGFVLRAAKLAFTRQHFRVVLVAPTAREARSLSAETGIRSTTAEHLVHGLTHRRGVVAGFKSALKASLRLWPGFRSVGGFLKFVERAAGRSSLNAKTVLVLVRPTGLSEHDQMTLLKHAQDGRARVVVVDGSREAAQVETRKVRRSRQKGVDRNKSREQEQDQSA